MSPVRDQSPAARQEAGGPWTKAVNLLLGRPLASSEQEGIKIGVLAGVAAMGLDGLSSAAYGPEAALAILVPLGAAGLRYVGPVMLVILVLLTMLYLSYRQTIAAYPVNGGSYTVARENLGTWASLLAAAALMIDYVLNVAVGISAGVAALVSAEPHLQPYTIWMCLGVLALITLMNLRGTGEAGLAFALPTYLFTISLLGVLAVGVARTIAAGGHPHPLVAPPPIAAGTEAVGLWLLLRSFASGCTAMTGVEAVSNGVSAFKPPTVKNAHWTLTAIVGILAILLGGVAFLAHAYQTGAMDQTQPGYQSILSQLTGAVLGRGLIYKITIASVLACLCLSANTSFVDFPRLCRLVATDGFLPTSFATVGRRLVYSVGIFFLAGAAGLLLVAFRGITDRLIPLFAVGAFLAFTLSQTGMVVHWRKEIQRSGKTKPDDKSKKPDDSPPPPKHGIRLRQWINGIGAVATGSALVIILAAKFIEGAWITVLAVPILLTLFRLVHRYYQDANRQTEARHPLDLSHNPPPVVLLPSRGWDRPTAKALRFAMWLSTDIFAVHLGNLNGDDLAGEEQRLRRQWAQEVDRPAREAGVPPPQFIVMPTPYRDFRAPLMKQVGRLKEQFPGRQIAIVLPEVVGMHWWQALLHHHRTAQLYHALMNCGDRHVIVVHVPWFVEE